MTWSSTRAKRASVPMFATALAAALVAVASPAPAEAAGAVVIKKAGSCTLLNGSGSLVEAGQAQSVKNKKRGLWKCTGKVTPGVNKKGKKAATTFSGKKTGTACITPNGSTMRWHETISASGRATLVCHFR